MIVEFQDLPFNQDRCKELKMILDLLLPDGYSIHFVNGGTGMYLYKTYIVWCNKREMEILELTSEDNKSIQIRPDLYKPDQFEGIDNLYYLLHEYSGSRALESIAILIAMRDIEFTKKISDLESKYEDQLDEMYEED